MNTTVMQVTDRPATGLLRTVLGVFKLRIGTLIMITALGGMAIANGPALSLAQVLVLALSVLVASASAGASVLAPGSGSGIGLISPTRPWCSSARPMWKSAPSGPAISSRK